MYNAQMTSKYGKNVSHGIYLFIICLQNTAKWHKNQNALLPKDLQTVVKIYKNPKLCLGAGEVSNLTSFWNVSLHYVLCLREKQEIE